MKNKIRVMIVDDHEMVRTGLRVLLSTSEDVEVVGEANSGQAAVQRYAELHPDVVLMDLVMPGMDGVTAIETIRGQYPQARIVALTSYHDSDLVHGALKAGAVGYLLKNVSMHELVDAVKDTYAGKSILAQEVAQLLVMTAAQAPTPHPQLTEREREVMAWVARGLNNRQIAERLYFSQSTVKKYIGSIFEKLGASSRAEAVARALKWGLIEVE